MTLDELSSGDDVKDTGVAAAAVNCAECVSEPAQCTMAPG